MNKLFVKSPLRISSNTPSNIRFSAVHIQTATKACVFGILAFHAFKYNVLITINTANSKFHFTSLIERAFYTFQTVMLTAVCKLHNVDIFKPKTPTVITLYHFQCFIKTSIYWKILSKICLKDDTVFLIQRTFWKTQKWVLKRDINWKMQFSGM
jgi:hypothetical protein